MGERTSYPPGTFSWAELQTSDADAAKTVYTGVFGWTYEDNPVGEGQVYTTALRDGKHVAAMFQGDQPPHWNNYATVESADATAVRAGELGGTVMAEPFGAMTWNELRGGEGGEEARQRIATLPPPPDDPVGGEGVGSWTG